MSEKTDMELPIFMRWIGFMDWQSENIEKFPRSARHTYARRLEDYGLDVAADLVDARFSKNPAPILKRSNLRLEQIRVVLRLSHSRRYLSHRAYDLGTKELIEIGKMLGGWKKSVHNRVGKGAVNGSTP